MRSTVDVLAGTFKYILDGSQHTAEFFVRCEPKPNEDDPYQQEIDARRINALNEQSEDIWTDLQCKGASQIQFSEALPNPFF